MARKKWHRNDLKSVMLYISKYRLILVLSVLNISVLISKHKNNFAKGYTPN